MRRPIPDEIPTPLIRNREPLHRVRLGALPPAAARLRPTRSLRDFVTSYSARRGG